MNLEEIRKEIDRTDEQLTQCFVRRMQLAEQVAEYKLENGLPVFDEARERKVLDRASERAGGLYAQGAKVVYTALMDVSKSRQQTLIASRKRSGPLRESILRAVEESAPLPESPPVACQGVPGAYSHEAALKLFSGPELRFYPRFEDVFRAVESGEMPFGVLPIENSTAGSVREVYDLLDRYDVRIAASCKLPIRHCLLACGEASLESLSCVYSHEQALEQCADFFRAAPSIKPVVCTNTAAAARMVAEEQQPDCAAIASEACAELYGLRILRRDLQNAKQNFTRFLVITRELRIPPDADKISLSCALPHETGSLYRLISRFAMNGLNLFKLESRPLPDTDFEFLFTIDIEGSVRDEPVLNLLCTLSEELARFRFLGNYR